MKKIIKLIFGFILIQISLNCAEAIKDSKSSKAKLNKTKSWTRLKSILDKKTNTINKDKTKLMVVIDYITSSHIEPNKFKEIINPILEHDPNLIYKIDKNGRTPLMLAIHLGYEDKYEYLPELIEFLIENGAKAKINDGDNFGNTALQYADHRSLTAIKTVLKKNGSNGIENTHFNTRID